jgi:hypothetical protein
VQERRVHRPGHMSRDNGKRRQPHRRPRLGAPLLLKIVDNRDRRLARDAD